jgi:phage FluMu protein Com
MIFTCEHCGRRLTVSAGQAGKQGRCPQCKKVVTVPTGVAEETAAQPEVVALSGASPRNSLLFDAPPPSAAAPETPEQAEERLRALQRDYVLRERDKPPQRPLPWVLDIFLYPLCRSSLIILALGAAIPLVLRVFLRLSRDLALAFPPGVILWVLFIIAHWGALLVFVLYINWYVAECIRDSAAGGIRALDTTALTPGVGELIGQSLTVLACGAACMAPAILYTRGHDDGPLFWVLYGAGGFLFPMALLAVTLFDSLRALSPVLLLSSLFSTFVPYCFLAASCLAMYLLAPLVIRCLFSELWLLGYLLLFVTFYLALVLAHLVGRFYWRNEERLNWDT